SVAPIDVTTYSITGVDVTNRDVGPVSASQITAGRFFFPSETNAAVAILDRGYAKQHELSVGSTVSIDETEYTVVGIATSAAGSESSNVYIPLARAQKLAGTPGQVNRIYVKASSSSQIPAVKTAIERTLPDATVTTADDLASQVTGSLASASSLAKNLGTWLSVAALVAAFAVASLLTMGAVARRVREFGTLKALGWRTRRVVGQVMGEAVVQGVLGGIVGIGVGVLGAFLVSKFSPTLTATVGRGGGAGPVAIGPARDAVAGAAPTVTVPLTAPVDAVLVALAIALALLGGVIAGSLGGWRAARLRPADALRRIE
ncbi:MAG: ABC transporter permease, partial [Actinomycetota bacterium]